jgi:ABC-type multidrug transport system ATPase subunit
VIALEAVGKDFRSLTGRFTVTALDGFSLEIARGEVLGLAGPNGAGKSTLISLVLGYLHPTRGRVTVGGKAPRAYAEAHGVGYLTELVALPPTWRTEAVLNRFACLGDLGSESRARVKQVMELTGLAEHRDKLVRQLSKGTLQRLGLAIAFLGDRELVILDEPTHGLDPLWTQRFREMVRQLRRPDRAILIASHNLDELERVADRVAIIHKGRLERVVQSGAGVPTTRYRLVLAAPAAGLLETFPGAVPIEGRALAWRIEGELAALNAGLGRLLAQGGQVVEFGPAESGLEREFRAALGEGQ